MIVNFVQPLLITNLDDKGVTMPNEFYFGLVRGI